MCSYIFIYIYKYLKHTQMLEIKKDEINIYFETFSLYL